MSLGEGGRRWAGFSFLVALLVTGCASSGAVPPGPGYQRGGLPELRGTRVMILPLQLAERVHPDLERELVYALREAEGGGSLWVSPDELALLLQRSPGMEIPLRTLPVRPFLAGELQRVGDPLFGQLYRLGVLSGAGFALLPVEARVAEGDGPAPVQLSAALLDTRTGQVLWFGILQGEAGPIGALAPAATVAEVLARRLLP